MIQPEDMAILSALCRSHGLYAITQALCEVGKEACEKRSRHSDSTDAVIYRDTAVLVDATDKMRQNHPIRG